MKQKGKGLRNNEKNSLRRNRFQQETILISEKQIKTQAMILKLLPAIFILFYATGCNLQENPVNDELKITEKTALLIKAENEFGFELFQKVFASETQYENIVISPLSVGLALAMTNGAEGGNKNRWLFLHPFLTKEKRICN